MKKRLRKKLRLGEWQTLAFKVTFACSPTITLAGWSDLSDHWTTAHVNADLYGWGFGRLPNFEDALFVPKPFVSATEAQRATVAAWLEQEPEIVTYEVGPLNDRFHSPEWMCNEKGSRYWGRIARRMART